MESIFGRYRNLIILVGVLFLQLLGLAVQVKRSDSENTRVIRIWAVDAITPFERALVSVQDGCGNLWHNYFYLRGVRAENRQLKEQIQQMRLEQVRLSQDAEQAHRLQSLLAFKEQMVAKTVAAQVIGSSGSDLSRIVYIDKGENEGLKADMPVVTADGIVGKILLASASVAQVLLINDQSSGVGVILEKSRLQGVLRGTPDGEVVLERVMSDEQVAPGERILSSGGDQIFPKGMPVGIVSKVSPGKELFLDIKVKPAADLSRLEEVLVITDKQERQPVAETTGKVRAADILAQRLPSVPDQPAAGTDASGKAANTANAAAGKHVDVNAGANAPTAAGVKPQTTPQSGLAAGSGVKPADSSGTKAGASPASAPNRAPGVQTPRTVSAEGQIANPQSAVEKTGTPNGVTEKTNAAAAPGTKASTSSPKTATPQTPKPKPPAAANQNDTPPQDGPR